MGNSSTESPTASKVVSFEPDQWKEIPLHSYTNNADPQYSSNFTVLAHRNIQGLEAERYELFFNSQAEYASYLENYYIRKKTLHLVNTLHIEQTTKRGMCSTFHSAAIYLERIPIRLFEIIDMPLGEGLYMLEVALEGYEKMFQKTGYFQISSDMIGINRQGKVKVWINRNFSKNFPDFNKIDHNQGEAEFVLRIISIIDSAIDYNGNCPKFLHFVLEKKIILNFQTAKSLLKLYIQNLKLSSQRTMKSILIVYRNYNPESQILTKESSTSKSSSFFKMHSAQKVIKKSEETEETVPQENPRRKSYKRGSKNLQEGVNHDILEKKIHSPAKEYNKKVNNNHQRSRKIEFDEEVGSRNTIHHSFIKNQPKGFDLDECILLENERNKEEKNRERMEYYHNNPKSKGKASRDQKRGSNKNINSSVSFHYKNSPAGFYSPQNLTHFAKPIQWFQQKAPQVAERAKNSQNHKKQTRKSVKGIEEKMKYFNSNGDMHVIDPDIARDLQHIE